MMLSQILLLTYLVEPHHTTVNLTYSAT